MTRSSRRQQQDTVRIRDATYLQDEELAYGFVEREEEEAAGAVVRVGRGLVSVKKAGAGAGREEREAAVFRNRGRKTERVFQ